jgi:hypothetical protein
MASEIQTEPSKEHLFGKIIYFREIGKNMKKNNLVYYPSTVYYFLSAFLLSQIKKVCFPMSSYLGYLYITDVHFRIHLDMNNILQMIQENVLTDHIPVAFTQGVILNVLFPWIFTHISTISIFCFILFLNFPRYL